MPVTLRPNKQRVVILGGGYAGLTAAQRLCAHGEAISLTLIDDKSEFQERIRLHQVAAGQTIPGFPYRDFLESRGVTFLQGQVIALAPDKATFSIRHSSGMVEDIGYDYLIYALGSKVDANTIPGVQEHAHAFLSTATAACIHETLIQPTTSQVLVVGGGLTGIETAVELAESLPHLKVSLAVDKPWKAGSIPGGFNEKAVTYLNQALVRHKVALQTGIRVERVCANVAQTADGRDIPFDVCIWTSGFAPQALAREAGIEVNQRGQIVTDAFLRSISHPNIVAIGDAAGVTSNAGDCRMSCATGLAMATAGARTVLALIKGDEPPAFRFTYLFRNVSLGRRDGLIQFVDHRDVPRSQVWTGAKAAAWKEYICRGTLSTIGLRATEKMPALPPIRILPQLLRGIAQYA